MELIRVGKVKKVFSINDKELLFEFTNNISVFDKIIPSEIPDKGASLCRTSAHWFQVSEGMGIRTHFIALEGNNKMRVKRFSIVNRGKRDMVNYLIPLEFITRYYIAGSLYDRLNEGKIKKEDLGIKNVKYGEPLPQPFFEVTTKFEEHDRNLDLDEAMEISGLDKKEIDEIKEIILKVDERINRDVKTRGLIHVDGKKELALDGERVPYLVDTFGTADEDRFWDLGEYEKGNFIELSKEFVRQYYRNIGYHQRLMEAREKGLPEPPIPPLPEDMIKKTSILYRELYEKITGKKW
ncbi:MAG: phosphoribosylaminoimidazolesuccinocarboxamide synthase [Thermoplasmata archaeon]|jgi:phosphoribosylaminoimidazole-succinocarboxamide synthase|nr:phosphoribosylaminoimidazolesuccinocarboxamide synthase [Thermoplasmatales archaeon]PMP74690.1 MAG: phosphoribosylaminoimidazolesuccinocarboxamide synthase [Aciduliprofundum sp.]